MSDKPSAMKRRCAWGLYLAGALAVFLILAARQAADLRSPPLVWEDGTLFLSDALNHPFLRNLLTPFQGYLHAAPRLAAECASANNLPSVPFIYRLISLAAAAGALAFPLAPIFRARWSLTVRLTITLLGALLPWQAETLGNITCLHWYLFYFLALLSLARLEHPAPLTWLLLSAAATLTVFSSPLCVLCVPVLLVRLAREKEPFGQRLFFGAILVLIAVMLAVVKLVLAPQPEIIPSFQPRLVVLFLIKTLGYCTGCVTALGEQDAQRIGQTIGACLAACGVIAVLVASGFFPRARAKANAWAGCCYYLLMPLLFAALMRPMYVEHFAVQGAYSGAGRYFLVPSLFLLLAAVIQLEEWARRFPNGAVKGLLIVLICAYAVVIHRNFRYPSQGDYDWPRHAAEYEAARRNPGTNEVFTVTLAHDPPWIIRLPLKP